LEIQMFTQIQIYANYLLCKRSNLNNNICIYAKYMHFINSLPGNPCLCSSTLCRSRPTSSSSCWWSNGWPAGAPGEAPCLCDRAGLPGLLWSADSLQRLRCNQSRHCLRFTEDSSVYRRNSKSFRIPSVVGHFWPFTPFLAIFRHCLAIYWAFLTFLNEVKKKNPPFFWPIFLIFLRFSLFLRPIY
jgi:hypothetical protein